MKTQYPSVAISLKNWSLMGIGYCTGVLRRLSSLQSITSLLLVFMRCSAGIQRDSITMDAGFMKASEASGSSSIIPRSSMVDICSFKCLSFSALIRLGGIRGNGAAFFCMFTFIGGISIPRWNWDGQSSLNMI